MSLQLDVRLGEMEPQIVHLPPDVASLAAAEEAIELADSYGIADGHPLDESQRFTLRAGLGERADGSWAAATVGDFEPRQNGKNDTCAGRELAGLVLFGEKLILHTAHEFKTANESFIRMVRVFEAWDDLRRLVARIRYASGEQGIEMLSGQRLKYMARTGGSGRGFAKADLTVYDEAQHLASEHVAASGPTRLANPNSQSWYMGSGGLSTSANAWRLRKRALAGNAGRFAYVEHTAEQVSLEGGRVKSVRPDLFDREAWAKANPAYGRRITDESMLSLIEELDPDLALRECLCVWDAEPISAEQAFPSGKWQACADVQSTIKGSVVFGVEVSWDRQWASICSAGIRSDGLPHVEVIEHRKTTGWVAGRLAELVEKWGPAPVVDGEVIPLVVLDPGGPAGGLLPDLDAKKVDVKQVSTREATQACGLIFDDVAEERLRHLDQLELNQAVADGGKRSVGDAWLWERKGSVGVTSPLGAATLARWWVSVRESNDESVYEGRGLVSL
jgi:hypothetical protein